MDVSQHSHASTAADDAELEALGYKRELKREMGLFTNFAMSFSIVSVLTGLSGESQAAEAYPHHDILSM